MKNHQLEKYCNEKNVFELNENELADFRNKNVGFVFQFHHLPEFTALENVCIPAFYAKTSQKNAVEKAEYLLNQMGIADRLDHKPSELSGRTTKSQCSKSVDK